MPITSRDIWRETWLVLHVLVARASRLEGYGGRHLLGPASSCDFCCRWIFFYELIATEESISPREFCGSRAVWLGDSHKHSNCGEKAEATDGRVLHQSAHGRSERAGGVLGRGRRPAGSASLRRTSDLVGDGGSPGMVAGHAALCWATARSIITGRGDRVSALAA